MILYLLDKSIMIAQLLKHELSNKTRKFTLDTGEELEASLESTEQGVAIFASKKVDEITQVWVYSVHCDGVIVKTLSKKCTVPKGDILSLRYTIHVTGN